MKKVVLLCLAVALSASGSDPEVVVLDNGLTVILQEMHYAPTVAVVTTYLVGGRNETDEISGISHFLEHMMFNGTDDMPGPLFWQLVQRNGGQANAGTGSDRTTYYLYMPTGSLEEALSIESDRMSNLRLNPEQVAQEIGVVTDEWRLSQDSPFTALFDLADSVYFGDTPYGMRVVGRSEAIAAFDSAKVADYYRTWYVPGNAFLAVVGDFESDEALRLIEQYYGGIPADEPPVRFYDDPAPVSGPIELAVEYPAEADRLLMYFGGCDRMDPDLPALVALSFHLGRGRSSWLQENLVSTGLATSAWASSPSAIGVSPFSVMLMPAPGVAVESLAVLVREEMFRLAREPLSPEELEDMAGYFTGRQVMDGNNPMSVAMRLAGDMAMTGDPLAYEDLRRRVNELTPEEVREVASRHFVPERMITAVLRATPGGSGSPTPLDGVSDIPTPQVTDWAGLDLSPEGLVIPEQSVSAGTVRLTLDNGLTLLVKEDHSFEIVEMIVAFPMGDRRAAADASGMSRITTETMLRGADGLDQSAFHQRLERVGGGIWLQPYDSFTIGNVYGHSAHSELYFECMADLLMRPNLGREDFERVRDQFMEEVRLQDENVMSAAMSRFDGVLLQEGARAPDSSTVSSVDYEEMTDWFRTCVRPDGCILAIVGDISPEEALSLAETHFGAWEAPPVPVPGVEPFVFGQTPGDMHVEHIEGRMEACVLFGCPAPSFRSPEYPAFEIMSSILGGGISSRMGMNLRETQGLTYAVGCWVDSPESSSESGSRFTGYFLTGAPFAARAMEAATGECSRIAEGGVLEEELLLRKFQSIGYHALGFDVYDELATYLATCEMLGIPLDSDLTDLHAVMELDVDDIREVAERYFTGDWFVSAAGGIDQQLQPTD